jgi:hypothetical protein
MYAESFSDLPIPDRTALQQATIQYLESFSPQTWYDRPMTTILQGKKLNLNKDLLIETKDAFGKVNGLQQLLTKEQVQDVIQAIISQTSTHKDLRLELREIEQKLLTIYAGSLIGNQCLDFGKQDGITEMEEAIMANEVERKLNDMLLKDEIDGILQINRQPIYVSCVSNFTLFLDLFRKTIRSLELGIPCVILGRTHTSQHSFRWAELLSSLLNDYNLLHLLTFISCSLQDIIQITKSTKSKTGTLYTTCSREVAKEIKSGYTNTVASTGGPNTMVTTDWSESVQAALRISATIESSGQCTALRHCVIPRNVSKLQIEHALSDVQGIENPQSALKNGSFDGIFKYHTGSKEPNKLEYKYLEDLDVFYKVEGTVPQGKMKEYWRKVVIDFSSLIRHWERDESEVYTLAQWINQEQPISLAINSKEARAIKLGKALFEKTGLVVYTIGSTNDQSFPPALTCQARPQNGEIFGELPPRKSLHDFTKFPVIIPSPNPSYDSTYTKSYLSSINPSIHIPSWCIDMISHVQDIATRGFCYEILNYLHDATRINPKEGFQNSRTTLWGLQRPPLLMGQKTLIRCPAGTSFDALAPILLIFRATNARDQIEISAEKNRNDLIFRICHKFDVPILVQSCNEYRLRAKNQNLVFNSVELSDPMKAFPMVGSFVSQYMCIGHIKSTRPNDEAFLSCLTQSEKWLQFAPQS